MSGTMPHAAKTDHSPTRKRGTATTILACASSYGAAPGNCVSLDRVEYRWTSRKNCARKEWVAGVEAKRSPQDPARWGLPLVDPSHPNQVAAILLGLFLAASSLLASDPADKQTVLVVIGAEGTAEFGQQFVSWADRWADAARRADATFVRIGTDKSEQEDRDHLRAALAAEQTASRDTLWLVLIGHGTFDGRNTKFNLRATDVSAVELADWLRPHSRPVVVVNCASSSGPFINALSASQRVIITATKSGQEQNFARFGDHFSAALTAPAADLDRDGQTSVLEAFLSAAHGVTEFYEQESRLATEHPLLDDTGDGLGTPADWFQGVRAVRRPQNATEVDGRRARQFALVRSDVERGLTTETRAKRDALELELEKLRDGKPQLDEATYYERLERVLRQLAELYRD